MESKALLHAAPPPFSSISTMSNTFLKNILNKEGNLLCKLTQKPVSDFF